MTKVEVLRSLLPSTGDDPGDSVTAFAPINIALCKYWGKRDRELHLPYNSSFSVTIPGLGTRTSLSRKEKGGDQVIFNGKSLPASDGFYLRLIDFINLFREVYQPLQRFSLRIETTNNIPVAAGLASSASGFAALILALNELCKWKLDQEKLSIIARLGSGSACRSLYPGFVEWIKGKRPDGMDSFGVPFNHSWEGLKLGLLIVNKEIKPISSRIAMEKTATHSIFFQSWIEKAETDVTEIKTSIINRDFSHFSKIVESNALAMHATMWGLHPPIIYWKPETLKKIEEITSLRNSGLDVCFTIDAGPNIKILYTEKDAHEIEEKLSPDFCIKLFT